MSHRRRSPANPANAPSSRFFSDVGITSNMRVLDVGCGNGDLSRLLARIVGPGGEVLGIDRSEEALASARAIPPNTGAAPIRYHTAELDDELPDLGVFDAIVGRRVLMYLPDVTATLTQLARFAKSGTILALQEHARADLPSGMGALPVHRQFYRMMWDTVAAENGDVALGYRLPALIANAGFTVEHARSEGVLIQPWEESFVPTLMRAMVPRMVKHGVAQENEVDLDMLTQRLDDERTAVNGTIFWDLAFLVAGRFGSLGGID